MDINYRLLEAVDKNDLELATQCLIDGANPCHIFHARVGFIVCTPTTAFEEACDHVNVELIEIMLKYGADYNLEYPFMATGGVNHCISWRPLYYVVDIEPLKYVDDVMNGKIYEAVELLLKAGADPDHVNIDTNSTAYDIAHNTHLSAAKLLRTRQMPDKLSLIEFIYEISLKRIPEVCTDIKMKPGNMGSKILEIQNSLQKESVKFENLDLTIRDYLGIENADQMCKISEYVNTLYGIKLSKNTI